MAESQWLEVLGWGPQQVSDLRVQAYSFVVQGLYDKATALFEGLIVLNGHTSYDYQTLGALYLELREYDKALRMLDQALVIDPTNLPSLLNKAKVLLQQDRINEGLEVARSLLQVKNSRIRNIAEALIMAYG